MTTWRALSLVLLSLVLPGALLAQDAVTVGTVTADDATVDVPVYIRDASGTPLGMDRPAGSKIQSFSIKVLYSPASAISSVTFSRAGITSNLSPTLELSPSSAGAISLLETFPEDTNLIPFTLNAGGAGNLVAHLVFTLSPTATPGTPISLTVDSSLTQLTDSGGTAATKETEDNGQLTLVDGQIVIPVPTLTITPDPLPISMGGSSSLRVTSSTGVIRSTSVTLSSSDPSVATVPPSMTIAAGLTRVDVPVTGVGVGSAIITATLPASMGGASDTATVNVEEAEPPPCLPPSAPQISAPATASGDASYAITWPAVANATEYIVEESMDAGFAGATQKTVTGTSASYTHGVSADTRFYYRVRARNHATGCDLTSANSNAVSTLVQAPAGPVQLVRVIPVVGSVPGQAGSNFKTSMQLFNPHDASISGNVVLHRSGTPDALLPYTLGAGKGVAFDDLLAAMGTSGIGTADIVTAPGSGLPISSVRVFNDAGADGTSGLAEDALDPNTALQAGESASIIAPSDFVHFRLNIGIRTLLLGASFNVTARDRDGVVVKSVERNYGATFFGQVTSGQLLDGYVLTGGESLTFTMHSGSAFIYGATTDNTTNDPSMQLSKRAE